jgi:hypothetical protein
MDANDESVEKAQEVIIIVICFKVATKAKTKAVPLHAMKALGGRGGIAPTHTRPWH